MKIPETIEGLHPTGGNSGLIAGFKVGKTTIAVELIAALADGRRFLGRFPTALPPGGCVGFWSKEMVRYQTLGWFREADMAHPERVAVQHLRGLPIDLTSEAGARATVDWLSSENVKFWVIDAWASLVASCGGSENDNDDALRLTAAIDEIKRRADCPDLLVLAHTGRAEQEAGRERARGATRLDDWLDARWLYTKDGAGQRFLRADGRDVDVDEFQVHWDDRRVTAGVGGRREAKADTDVQEVLRRVAANPGLSSTELRDGNNSTVPVAIQAELARRLIHVVPMPRNKKAYFPGPDPQQPLT